ncbi:MAG: alpha/beta hydrolase [Anaerolineales bacterium]
MSITQGNPNLLNAHLDGNAFYLQGGPVGVFLSHGYTATAAEVRPLAEALQARGYTVAGPLLAGHGTEPANLNRVRWQDWVASGRQTLAKLLETCEQVFIGGESLGGLVALYLAGETPQARGVLLYAPAIALQMTWLDKLKLYVGAPFVMEVPRDSLDCDDKWQGYPGLPLKGAVQLLKMQKAVRARLPEIRQPVLVFQGRLDTTVAPEAGEMILQGVASPQKERVWMENSHHTIVLDVELEEVVRRTMAFIEDNL